MINRQLVGSYRIIGQQQMNTETFLIGYMCKVRPAIFLRTECPRRGNVNADAETSQGIYGCLGLIIPATKVAITCIRVSRYVGERVAGAHPRRGCHERV